MRAPQVVVSVACVLFAACGTFGSDRSEDPPPAPPPPADAGLTNADAGAVADGAPDAASIPPSRSPGPGAPPACGSFACPLGDACCVDGNGNPAFCSKECPNGSWGVYCRQTTDCPANTICCLDFQANNPTNVAEVNCQAVDVCSPGSFRVCDPSAANECGANACKSLLSIKRTAGLYPAIPLSVCD